MESQANKKQHNSDDSSEDNQFLDAEKTIPRIINHRFELKDELGRGAHGRIYSGRDRLTRSHVAVKLMDKISKNKSKYSREIGLMKDMQAAKQIGFPRLLYHASDKNYFYIVMEQLGTCLKEQRDKAEDGKLSLKTVTMIALQLLQRLESIHKLNYVHRDLKPANIMTGRNKSDQSLIYLIDFGLAKKINSGPTMHNDNGNKVVGTAIYAGLNAHIPGSKYYKKDDLESMMYVLCYLGSGTLPWKSCKSNDFGLEKMMKMKMKISPYELFSSLANEYGMILDHIKQTPNEAECDYSYIAELFRGVAQNQKFKIDNQFDWLLSKKGATQKKMILGVHGMAAESSAGVELQPTSKAPPSKKDSIKDGANGNQIGSHKINIAENTMFQFDPANQQKEQSPLRKQQTEHVLRKPFKQEMNTDQNPVSQLAPPTSALCEVPSNAAMNEDQGGSALQPIQEKEEEKKETDKPKLQKKKKGVTEENQNQKTDQAKKEKSLDKRTSKGKQSKVKDKDKGKEQDQASLVVNQQDREGKIQLNLTLNFQNQNQNQSLEQSDQQQQQQPQIVEMTINRRDDGVNFRVQISTPEGGKQGDQSSFQQHVIAPSLFKATPLEAEASNYQKKKAEAQQEPEQQCEEFKLQPGIDEEEKVEDVEQLASETYEEFENGINSELIDRLILDQSSTPKLKLIQSSPRTFHHHSNVSKMQNNVDEIV